MAAQTSRREIIGVLRETGFIEVADTALRTLPDPVDLDRVAEFLISYGITKDELVSRLGGSP